MKTHIFNYQIKVMRMRMTSLLLISLLFSQIALAQMTVKGTVADSKGNSLPYVSVSVKGTTNGTSTDNEGNYSITIPSKEATLQFSFIGYLTKDEVVGDRSVVNVSMQDDAAQLDEVVVVGYGTQRKITLTGAVASIKGDEALSRNTVSLSSALVGTMPGVTVQQTSGEPGADGASIRIRGVGSLSAGQSPLILVDGLEVSIDQIDPSTIESINTLKDASSASIYGSRAANGVILITTKRGKEGPVKVTYRGTVSSQSATSLPNRVSSADFMEYSNIAASNVGASLPFDPEKIEYYRKYKPDNWNNFDTDWASEILKDRAFLNDHTVTLTGGSSTLKFMGVGKFISQNGLVENNGYKRFNLRLNTDAQIYKWLKLTVDANIVKGERKSPSVNTPKSLINKALYFSGLYPGINADGTWGGGRNGDNPIAAARVGGTKLASRPESNLSGKLIITPVEGVEIMAQYSRGDVVNRDRNLVTPWRYYNRGVFEGLAPLSGDGLTESWNQNVRNMYITHATFSKDIKEHSFKVLGGFQAEDNTYTSFSASRGGFEFPGYYFLSNAVGEPSVSGGKTSWAMASLYSRINYVFKDRYMLELNGRWDASSRFREGLRWSLFPSFSAGWIFSEEAFSKSISEVLNFGKLRVSYGSLGNQALGEEYPGWSQVNTGWSYWFNKELNPGVAITSGSNPSITWEKSTQLNLGLDLAFMKKRLSVTADFYVKTIDDMIMQFPPPYFDGLSAPYTNAAKMRNTGWEVSVGYKGNIGKFNYGANLVVDDVRNKVLDLKGRVYTDFTYVEGYPANGIWGYETDGYFQTADDLINVPYFATERPNLGYVKYVDQDGYVSEEGNKVIDPSKDKVFLGDPFPHFNYGLKLTGAWNGFDCLVFIQGVGERKAYLSGIGLQPFANGASVFQHQTDFWSENNRNAEFPILLPVGNSSNNFQTSDKWVRSGAYARLKTLEFGYTLPLHIVKKMQISSVRLFVSGQNLFTMSNFYKGYDPEVSVTSASAGAANGEFYPVMRLYSFGLDIKF